MSKGQNESGIGRRDFFRTVIGGAAALSLAGAFPGVPKMVRQARADQPGSFGGCRLVVFGSDSLRFDYAQTLVNDPEYYAPALSSLVDDGNPIICSLTDGFSCTQPGWASIWTGLPSYWTRVFSNNDYEQMPRHMHIMRKLISAYKDEDLFLGWITGKGRSISGKRRTLFKDTPQVADVWGPHWQVKKEVLNGGHLGVYLGDEHRENDEVFNAASSALEEIRDNQYANFCCFIHFKDPDHAGHVDLDYDSYMAKAVEVDQHIWDLMGQLPANTDVIYCSDHGFDLRDNGDRNNHHNYSPYGMLATNFPTANYPVVDIMSVGRLIYRLAGGDPDDTSYREWDTDKVIKHPMYGIDLV